MDAMVMNHSNNFILNRLWNQEEWGILALESHTIMVFATLQA